MNILNFGITMTTNLKKGVLGAGLLLCLSAVANAQTSNTVVTFSVDMTVQTTNGTFVPGTDTAEAHGTFNGWGALILTNDPAAANPNIYSGTITNTTDPNDGVMQYKYVIDGSNWENPADNGKNRAAKLPSASGATLVLPTPYFSDAGNPVTNTIMFQVNMAQQINLNNFTVGSSTVYARGDFNGFDLSVPLTNDPSILATNEFGLVTSNVYVGATSISASPNAAETFKYYYDPGANWETPSSSNGNPDHDNNRFFVNAPQTLPLVDYSDAPYAPIATNNVTFQVDMSAQLLGGQFDPSQDTVEVRGSFNGWSGGINVCTNDPGAANTNLYSTDVTITDGVGVTEQYKFAFVGPNVSGGTQWENPAPPTVGGNRFFYQPNAAALVLPSVYFSDQPVNDLLPQDTMVTFMVDMNGAVGTDMHQFDPSSDTVYVNGQFANWYAWWDGVNPVPAPSQYQLFETPVGSGVYSNSVMMTKGTAVAFEYKYGIGEAGVPGPSDVEAGMGLNHYRVIRAIGTGTYAMPLDKWGQQYHEPLYGNLTIGDPSGGNVSVSWLGRPGMRLQTLTNLTGDTWQDHFDTDGTNWTTGSNSTNGFISTTSWPVDGSLFFRLIKP